MIVKTKNTVYVCQSCGGISRKWSGKCDSCGAWDSIVEEEARESVPKGMSASPGKKLVFEGLKREGEDEPRSPTGIGELDRVLGGGLVAGSAILVGGDPGIGKSTLLLQLAASISGLGKSVAYISGEESITQLQLRAERLGLSGADVSLASATSVRDIVSTFDRPDAADLLIIDSIQTMYIDALESAPGTVAQVRSSAFELIRMIKRRGTALFIVGHVTKEGQIAGPKVLEHMVDTVLYFEGERGHQFRILRSVKNRFGGTDEIGVFEMSGAGLAEVSNPSSLFLSDSATPVSGSAVFAGMEGTRPLMVEVQALVASTFMASPRRAVVGWDVNRLAMVLAVLETRSGVAMLDKEVYLNVAGGLRVSEPAADLAVASALVSSCMGRPMPPKSFCFGEIGLSGEIRKVSHCEVRLKEAAKLGFKTAFVPAGSLKKGIVVQGINVVEVGSVKDFVELF